KHFDELGPWRDVEELVRNMNGWIKACAEERELQGLDDEEIKRIRDERASARFFLGQADVAPVERLFSGRMSAKAALRLAAEWRERQAVLDAEHLGFPDPWYPGGTVNGLTIEPVRSADEMARC